VVVLSHSLWTELGSDPDLVGSRLELAGVNRTVVGVMPPGFWFPDPSARIWLANQLDEEDTSGNWGIVGRLAPGRTAASLRGELDRVMAWMHERFEYSEGEWDKRVEPTLTPLRDRLVGEVRPAVIATLVAMAVILLIACVNVSALMLGQMESRETEMAVRSALGAERRQLLRQLGLEALAIGVLAGGVGAVLATVGFQFLLGALPLGALAESAAIDWPFFAAAIGIALAASLVVALAPVIALARGDLQRSLTRARTGGIVGRSGRFESGLVIAQVGLVLLLAASAGLLIRSVRNLRAIDPGIRVEGRAVVDLVLPTTLEPARRSTMMRTLVEAVDALPGTRSVASAQMIPLRRTGNNWGIAVEGVQVPDGMTTALRPVTPGYLETMGVELRSGRMLREGDRDPDAEEGVIVINQALADQLFPGEDPLGRRIAFMDRWDRVVGVVGNAAEAGLAAEPVPAQYITHEQVPWLLPIETVVIRMDPGRDPASILEEARRAIQASAPTIAIQEMTTMEKVFDRAIGPARQLMSLLTLLGVVALALGTIGVYGVVSHVVSRRRRDWGIRLALGMRPERVKLRILQQGGSLVGAGVALGLVGFLLLARLLATFLYGVGAADPASLAGATAVLMAAGLLAAYLPARRASRIDPAGILRES
jgi:predicted permease